MIRNPFTTTLGTACACLMAHALIGCASSSPPKPRADAAAVVLDVVAVPKKGGTVQRFARVPVYDAAPRPAAPPSGQFELVDYSAMDNVIVWLQPAGATDPATAGEAAGAADAGGDAGAVPPRPLATPPSPVLLDVTARVHPDDVCAAAVGQEIVFRNRGGEPLSLYSVSDDNDFELPEIPPGGEARYTVRAEGLIEVLADPSDPPVAMAYVVSSPWVARTRSGGRVVFDDVTPGSYEVVSWHPRMPGSTAPLDLAAGTVARAAVKLGVSVLAEDQP